MAVSSSCSIACWILAEMESWSGWPRVARIGQLLVERALHAGDAVAVDGGEADDVGGEAGLRIEPVRLPLQRNARLA